MASRDAVLHIPEVDGESGRGAPRFSGAPDPDRERPLGYVCIPARMEVYQHGFLQRPAVRPKSFCPVSGLPIFGTSPRGRGGIGAKRGKITTMTHASARRMREDILKKTVVDARIFDVTLTVPGEWPLEEFKRREKCLLARLVRAGLAGWVRREMQERGQAHLHLLIYAPNAVEQVKRNAAIYLAWWEILDEEQRLMDGAWKRHSVVKGPYTEATQAPEWMEYLCAHTTKRKVSQAWYEGKQWSRFGAKILEERAVLMHTEMTAEETKQFTRALGRYILARNKAKRNAALAKGKKYRKRLKRPPMSINARRIRFMPGDVVMRMIVWAKS